MFGCAIKLGDYPTTEAPRAAAKQYEKQFLAGCANAVNNSFFSISILKVSSANFSLPQVSKANHCIFILLT